MVLRESQMEAMGLELDSVEEPDAMLASAFRGKRKPGPAAANEPTQAERDLADAALILQLIDSGALHNATHLERQVVQAPLDVDPGARLSFEEEVELTRRIQIFGDIDARNTLVMANMGLVHLVASQLHRPYLRYDDLLQEGTIGLIRATETFEPHRQVRFSTYSVYWIRAKILRHIQHLEKDDIPSISGAKTPADEGKKRPRARKLSLEKPLDDQEGRSLSEVIPSDVEDPEAISLSKEKCNFVKKVLYDIVKDTQDERLVTLIQRRLLAEEPESLAQVGERLNLSREGARQLESRMLNLARQRLSSWYHT